MAASTFWLLNALNKSYSTQTTYPVKFVYNDKRLVPVKPLPEEVAINVTGKGWKLLRKALRLEVQPAEIYIRNLPRNNYLLGSALRPALVNAMDGLQLNFVVTDTLYFDFDSKVKRRVALKLDPRQAIAADRYAVVGPIRIAPDSITFTGPSSMVDSIPDPFVLRLPEQKLTAPAEIETPIIYDYQALVKSDIAEAVVKVNVKALVQEERQVEPELVNVPEGESVTMLPGAVLVRYQLLADSVPLMNRDSFKAVLDYAKRNQRDSTLVPELVQKPAGARNITLWPDRVKVILR
ncbi:YbbR-like domain-containing protein [Pontibacter ruber]|uniref:hypothetical protein n=1 Tax=Pontibacter ruber TaxID=1343895 RepID=UPI002027EDDC|nr:hypothetical protein [Pontibacter ruber]